MLKCGMIRYVRLHDILLDVMYSKDGILWNVMVQHSMVCTVYVLLFKDIV
jgi:hypothetical protein